MAEWVPRTRVFSHSYFCITHLSVENFKNFSDWPFSLIHGCWIIKIRNKVSQMVSITSLPRIAVDVYVHYLLWPWGLAKLQWSWSIEKVCRPFGGATRCYHLWQKRKVCGIWQSRMGSFAVLKCDLTQLLVDPPTSWRLPHLVRDDFLGFFDITTADNTHFLHYINSSASIN